jgi:four helix bundle protein
LPLWQLATMQKFRFLKWKVYQDSKELFSLVLRIVKKLPKEYRFEFGSQAVKSALSVILNIAEGSGKGSDKELNRFIDISLGSLYETLAIADVLKSNGLITKTEFDEIFKKIDNIADQLGGFKKKLS